MIKLINEFRELNINEAIIEALEKIDITTPTPIQREAIPFLLEGLDCIGQAQTGTGKTFTIGNVIASVNKPPFS